MQLERAQINAPQLSTSPPANVKRLVVEKRVSRVVVCCALPEQHYATAAHDAAACCLLAIYLAKKRIACNWCTVIEEGDTFSCKQDAMKSQQWLDRT
jgi:hypothetical protein